MTPSPEQTEQPRDPAGGVVVREAALELSLKHI